MKSLRIEVRGILARIKNPQGREEKGFDSERCCAANNGLLSDAAAIGRYFKGVGLKFLWLRRGMSRSGSAGEAEVRLFDCLIDR